MEEKQYYKEQRISSSSLKHFEQSPSLFKKYLNQELEQWSTYFLDKGKQIHMALLEPEEFKKNYTVVNFETPKSEQQKQFCEDYVKLPDKMLDDKTLLKAYKNNYKTGKNDEKILKDAETLKLKLAPYIEYLEKRKEYKDILSWVTWTRISDLKEGVVKHKLAKELMADEELDTKKIYNELIIFWEDPIHKLPCKSMIDRLVIDEDKKEITLIDLKTANTFNKFKDRCRDFSYFRQLAFYWYAIQWWAINEAKINIDDYTKKTYIIALKTTDDAEVKVFDIRDVHLTEGDVDMQLIMGNIAWHWENDKWEYSRKYYTGDGEDEL